MCPRGGGRSTGGVWRQLDAMQEAASPVKAFLSDALRWAASLTQPVA